MKPDTNSTAPWTTSRLYFRFPAINPAAVPVSEIKATLSWKHRILKLRLATDVRKYLTSLKFQAFWALRAEQLSPLFWNVTLHHWIIGARRFETT
jgi:hypothetical protein